MQRISNYDDPNLRPGRANQVGGVEAPPFSLPGLIRNNENRNIRVGWEVPGRWRQDTPYDQMQNAKDFIFVLPYIPGDPPNAPRLMTIGQVNLVLREAWTKFESALNPIPRIAKQPAVISAKQTAEAYKEEGEDYFNSSNNFGMSYARASNEKYFSLLNRISIMKTFRLLGVKILEGTASRGTAPTTSCTLSMYGRTVSNNYWSDLRVGDNLWFILKQTSTADGKIGPFQFSPWSGSDSPKSEDLLYEDVAGFLHRGGAYHIGQVTWVSTHPNSAKKQASALGMAQGSTLENIFKESQTLNTVDINVLIADDY